MTRPDSEGQFGKVRGSVYDTNDTLKERERRENRLKGMLIERKAVKKARGG